MSAAFAQKTEKQQKIQKRVERTHKPAPNSNQSSGSTVIITPRPYYGINSPYYYGNVYRDPYYNNFYYNTWPRPSVTLNTKAKRNTNSVKPRIGIGISGSYNENLPGVVGPNFIFGGQKTYLTFSYQFSPENPYTHYNNITYEEVLQWQDEFITNVYEVNMFDIGVASMINKKWAATLSIGNMSYKTFYVYNDELGILSNSGLYSINGDSRSQTILLTGVNYHINNIIIAVKYGISGPNKLNIWLSYSL